VWRNKLPTELLVEKPNYEKLISTLWREDDVDRVPFYDYFVDLEVIEHLLGVKLRDMDLNKEENKVEKFSLLLINWVRIDGKHSYEDAIMLVTKAKRLYRDEIAILGGVDVDKLSRYPIEEFTCYVKRVLRKCCPGGGYVLGSGNSITNYVNILLKA